MISSMEAVDIAALQLIQTHSRTDLQRDYSL